MKKILSKFAAALCAGAVICTSAAINVSAKEDDSLVLPSGEKLSKVTTELEDFENTAMDATFASAAVGIFQGDEILYTGYFGMTDIENEIEANEESVYEWGSISKTLVWVSVMQLWEQGKLDLDCDVREYLPEGFFQHLSYDEPITMMNLMNHNAGWQETTLPLEKTDENDIPTLREALQEIEPAQIHRPGEVSAYSNYGAAVAGYVVECVAGQDFCDYVHENIFEPLGMEHTALNPTHSDNEWVYENRKKTRSYKFPMGNCIDLGELLNYVSCYPAGAATGTLSDLMTYAQALVNDDAPLFQNKETQEIMFTGTDFYGESDIPMMAHGFVAQEYAVRTYGHSGATTAGQANMVFDLESKTGLVAMVNEPSGNWYLSITPTAVFGELSPEKYSIGSSEKADLSGYYLMARETFRGIMKYSPYLTAFSAKPFDGAEKIGDGVYQVRGKGELNKEQALIIGVKTLPDGRTAIQSPTMDVIHDPFYFVKLCLFTIYVLLAVAAVFQLLIRFKLKKHGKLTAYSGSAAMAAGQAVRIASVVAWLGSYFFYANYQGGIPFTIGAVIGIVQMIVMAVCGISAVSSCISMVSKKKEKAHTIKYILNIVCCVLPIITILYFEMYYFWGC